MLEIRCTGTPYEIGLTHGTFAQAKISSSILFYARTFHESCSLPWGNVAHEASKYVESLETSAPRYLEEIEGIATGSGTSFLDILALNVRSEIMFGLSSRPPAKDTSDAPSDACTSVAWKGSTSSFLAQNWDWDVEQSSNLLICHISQPGTGIPDFSMVTEAGIISKIGLNEAGTGCCLNALRCRGVDSSKLPIHFALRRVLESPSRQDAVRAIKETGVAAAGHIQVSDPTGSSGLECTAKTVDEMIAQGGRCACHTNHLLLGTSGDVDEFAWPDSPARMARVRELTARIAEPSLDAITAILKDTEGRPVPINRGRSSASSFETLFTIVMDLVGRFARVTFGRPTDVREEVVFSF
ncbi:peptidase C45 acyl-coenzyme A:6-aminopenicillanic acid acyl-transferase-like protein [Xylaria sp. CBS 124048]|nr:peptidase C45 acyl-coenzyme A:6-aminopenicillanic acid acyl-transferase-like protein [Xylaria sp. CBS 124048]